MQQILAIDDDSDEDDEDGYDRVSCFLVLVEAERCLGGAILHTRMSQVAKAPIVLGESEQ